MIAAATKNDHYSKDHDPGAVVIKDVTQAVIHYVSLRGVSSRPRRLVSSYANKGIWLPPVKLSLLF